MQYKGKQAEPLGQKRLGLLGKAIPGCGLGSRFSKTLHQSKSAEGFLFETTLHRKL